MKKIIASVFVILCFFTNGISQDISPWLFGQNHWMERTDEGRRPGYLYMLWLKVEESGTNAYARRAYHYRSSSCCWF